MKPSSGSCSKDLTFYFIYFNLIFFSWVSLDSKAIKILFQKVCQLNALFLRVIDGETVQWKTIMLNNLFANNEELLGLSQQYDLLRSAS